MLDARTLRCARFLTSLIAEKEWESAVKRAQCVSNLVSAAKLNLLLEHGLEVSVDQVAQWLGVAHLVIS